MIPERRPLFLELVDYEEYVDVDRQVSPSGEERFVPIEDTRKVFLQLQVPDGTKLRVEIPHERLDGLFALMFPEDYAAAPVHRGEPPSDAQR